MNSVSYSGRVQSVTTKEYDKKDGTKGLIAHMKFMVNDRIYLNQEWTNRTLFMECTAFDKQAETWEKNYTKGKVVEVIGRLGEIRHWEKKDGSGTAYTIVVAGHNGATPHVGFAPRAADDNEDSEPDF
jgi:single-stranded DNA-binding protein